MAARKPDRVLDPRGAALADLVVKPTKTSRRTFSTEKERQEALVDSRKQSQKKRISLGTNWEEWEEQRKLCGFVNSAEFVAHLLAVHACRCPQYCQVKAGNAQSEGNDCDDIECVPETPDRKWKRTNTEDSFESPIIPIYKKGMSTYQSALSRENSDTTTSQMDALHSRTAAHSDHSQCVSPSTSNSQRTEPSCRKTLALGCSTAGTLREETSSVSTHQTDFSSWNAASIPESEDRTALKSDHTAKHQSGSPSTSKTTPKQGIRARKGPGCSTPKSAKHLSSDIIPEEEIAFLTPIKEKDGSRRRRRAMEQPLPHSPKLFEDDAEGADRDDDAIEYDPDVTDIVVSDDDSDEETMPIPETNWRDLRVTMETEEAIDARKCIAFNGVLERLLIAAIGSTCRKKDCAKRLVFRHKKRGTCLLISWQCPKQSEERGHTSGVWSSQPRLHGMDAGTLLTSVALMTSGNNYAKIALMAKFLKLNFTSQSVHNRIQSRYVTPAINKYSEGMTAKLLRELAGEGRILGGDARCDSPGHRATLLTYTLIDIKTKKIVALVVVHCQDTNLNSVIMERLGFIKAMEQIKDKIEVVEIVTDAHPQIRKLMRTDPRFQHIVHQFDVWHTAKNLAKALLAAGKERGMGDIIPWIPAIKNHLWYASRTCEGDADKLRMNWQTVLYHVCDKHEWLDTTGHTQGHCSHTIPLPQETREKAWIKPGSKAQERLIQIVRKKPFVNNLSYLRNFRHTGDLEQFHSSLLMYAPKRLTFGPAYYRARCQLAHIDFNEHVDRPFLTDKHGQPVYYYHWSKGSERWGATRARVPKAYDYMPRLMGMAVEIREREWRHRIRLSTPKWHDCQDANKKPNIASVPRPPKDLLLARLQSRFQ